MKQTPNYNLPQFDGEDLFNKEDFNDAFKKIDTAISDLQETFNTTASGGALTTQEVINARKGKPTLVKKIDEIDNNIVNVNEKIDEIDNNIVNVNEQMTHMKEYLNYMPINGGDFDGNDNTHITIDGGTY